VLKGANDSKKTIVVKEMDSYDAPPLDFSFKSLKELKEILKEEPRNKGKRRPIIIEEDKKDDKKKDGKSSDEKKTEQTTSSVDQQAENEGEILEKPEGERAEEEQQEKPKEKEEPAKQKTQEIHIIPESHISTVIAAHNVSLSGVTKGLGGKNIDDNKVNQTKQAKINLICASIVLSYNEIRDLFDFKKIIDSVMYHSDKLSWIDLSHNHLTSITEEFKLFPNLRTLNLHCNYINDLSEVQKLAPVASLKNLTIHGNAIDTIPSFRLYIIGILPQLQKLDTVLISKKERDNGAVWKNSFGHYKFPKVKVPTFPPEKEKPKQAEQSD